MPIDFAPAPLLCMADADLFIAFALASVAGGVEAPPKWWNHASGEWDATFDAAAHVRPFSRLAAKGSPNGRWQSTPVPWLVATTRGACALAYTKNDTGGYVEWGFPGDVWITAGTL